LFGGPDSIDLSTGLDKLGSGFQIKTLLLEGGGKINGSMLCIGAIDELSILLAPVVDGSSGSPALFDTVDSAIPSVAGVRWKLSSMERRAGDIIWLRYIRGVA
jgi:2,5-diamino-6-(ribosylamino)-4(3H)-pyrimidinone 5'-phosphate reductase